MQSFKFRSVFSISTGAILLHMKVMITGASGFLGSWLCQVLSDYHEVEVLVRESSNVSKISQISNLQIIRSESLSWPNFVAKSKPDALILNDWWGVENHYRNDSRQFENVNRLVNLAKIAEKSGVKSIVGVGSQAELGPVPTEISEATPDNPTTKYGEAKVQLRNLMSEQLVGSSARFVWMRIFSTYGPLDEGSWLIPDIVDSLLKNNKMQMTKGEQEWSYLHAFDLAMAFVTVIENLKISGIVNVGNPETISIHEVGTIIGKILRKQDLLEFGALEYRKDQVMKMQPKCETLTNAGWRPQISFDQGIKQTIDWLQRVDLSPISTQNGETLNFTLPIRP